ncbi:dihydroorotate dehydrogenase [Chloroflexus sp.]|uniref:dihydroorotate dehydrogenase n=1 Tax=Chloroflexus sp. TaxID=1904827 RepID=UPI002637A520|nr:dihydroorotate dehydrogenase [uncultured Chloroflexus sp.]
MLDLAPHNPHTLTIATPVIAAAGSLGDVVGVARWLGLAQSASDHGLGAIISQTVTVAGKRGQPQFLPTPAGALYHHGGASLGLKQVRERLVSRWATYRVPVLVSIAGADAPIVAETLADTAGIAGFELALPALNAHEAARQVAAVRRATLLPLIVRLPGELPDPIAVAQASLNAGADAIALIGGLPACMPQADGGFVYGRLGGPAIFPFALRLVAAVAAAVDAPVIGMGGVATPEHARAMLAAGARAVALASALVADLRRAKIIADSLRVR